MKTHNVTTILALFVSSMQVANAFLMPSRPPMTTMTPLGMSSQEAETTTLAEDEANLKRLQELVGEHLSLDDPSKIQASTHFRDDLGADSLEVIELVLAVEQEFDIDIDDDYASHIETCQDALDYLRKNHNIETSDFSIDL